MKKALAAILIFVLVMLGIRTFFVMSCTIPSSGMENTLYAGERVLVNRWSYGYRVPFMSWIGYCRWGSGIVRKNDILLFNNPMPSSQKNIDSQDLFISRCVGEPGDTLMLNEELQLTNEKVVNPDCKQLYSYPDVSEDTVVHVLDKLDMGRNELVGYDNNRYIRSFSHYELYMLKQELGNTVSFTCLRKDTGAGIHPYVVPMKGKAVKVYPWNAKLLCNTLVQHENKNAAVRGDTLYIDGQSVKWCFFSQDYYWVSSNNPINMSDSRLFGFVPSTHLLGRAIVIWFSKDNAKSWNRGYRWNRFFTKIK